MGESPSHRHIADRAVGVPVGDPAQVLMGPFQPDQEQVGQGRHLQVRTERTLQGPHPCVHGQCDVLRRNRFTGVFLAEVQRALNN
jgi:hypothetical protein